MLVRNKVKNVSDGILICFTMVFESFVLNKINILF